MAIIASSPITLLVRDNFPVPEIGPDGIPTGQTTFEKRVVAWWYTYEFGVQWDYMYREVGTPIWLKPDQVANGRNPVVTGRHTKSIFLPFREDYETAYEFLPLAWTGQRIIPS